MSSYSLALKEPEAEPLGAAAFLSAVKGYTRDSAREFLRGNPGFLARNLQLEAARDLAAAAGQAGLGTMLIAETELPAPPPPLEADRIEPKGTGFDARAAGAVTFIPYDSITVFSAAAYDARLPADTVPALEAGLFEKIARLAGAPVPRPPEPRLDTFFRADIIAGNGTLRLQLKPENLDFSPLGPGRSPSSLVNFRALLGAISGPAFKAVKNGFLKAFVESRPLTDFKVASPEAAETELSRLMILSGKRRA